MKITEHVTWVGIQQPNTHFLHGFHTRRGTSYNSYLIQGEKNVLIDTVHPNYSQQFIDNLKSHISLDTLDYIIIQHGELDHSGALGELMRLIPETPVYCTEECFHTLKGLYHKQFNFKKVHTGDSIDLGTMTLEFLEMKMLHWPDNMASYLSGDHVLFSNDVFGQHMTSEHFFAENESDALHEAEKYYANTFTPFSRMMASKLKHIRENDYIIDCICPGHGLIWRQPEVILQAYDRWCHHTSEDLIVIFYDTLWNGTLQMARHIRDGIHADSPETSVMMVDLKAHDASELMHLVFKSKGFLLGSPTINNGYTSHVAAFLNTLKGLRFKKKLAATFGCYGWSGEATLQMKEELKLSGFKVMESTLSCIWHPNDDKIYQAQQFGIAFSKKITSG